MNYVQLAIPFFILAVALEAAWGALSGKQTYRLNDTINSLQMGVLSRLVSVLKLGFSGVVFSGIVTFAGIQPLSTESVWVWVVGFVAYDLCYYWKHRFGHEWRIMWSSHVAHHQSEEYNLSTALRQTGTDYIGFIFYLPLYLAGVPVYVVVTVGSLNLIYQFWVHTRHINRLGWLEWVLVTPSNHRVHHARNPDYIDKNYGGVFIVWDRLFGTFKDEDPNQACVYGITEQLGSWNPFWANFHVWVDTLTLSWHTKSWRDKVLVWFRGPAWKPADLRPPTEAMSPVTSTTAMKAYPKYDPVVSNSTRWVCFGQFWLLTAASLWFLGVHAELPRVLSLASLVWLGFSFYVQGEWLQDKGTTWWLEIFRLLALLVLLLTVDTFWKQAAFLPVSLVLGYIGVSGVALLVQMTKRAPVNNQIV